MSRLSRHDRRRGARAYWTRRGAARPTSPSPIAIIQNVYYRINNNVVNLPDAACAACACDVVRLNIGGIRLASIFRAKQQLGYIPVVDESTCDALEFCRFGLVSLAGGQSYKGDTGDCEVVLVVLGGKANISVAGEHWNAVGERTDVFGGKAHAVYAPVGSDFTITEAVGSTLQMAVCAVKADEKFAPFVVTPEEVVVHHRGTQTWTREVHDIIGDNGDGRVQRIVLGETYGDPGGWSSYPPHKHDEVSEQETKLEEIYFFQMKPENGFAVQLLYTDDREIFESHIVRHGDSFAIHKGYHPVVAAGGYRVYYLWFLGGAHGRKLLPLDQPEHRWLLQK